MRALKIFLPLLLALAALPLAPRRAAAAAGPWEKNPQSSVRLISPWQVAPLSPSNGELRLGLHFKLAPGWHVYWKNSGDAGFPPVVVFGKTAGLEKAELLWPAPERFELRGGLVAFGYGDEVVYPIRGEQIHGPAEHLQLTADVDYLVCEVDCVPYRYTLSLDQPLGTTPVPDPVTAPLVDVWWSRLPVAAEALAGVTTDGVLEAGGPVLEIRLRGVQPAPGTSPGLFLESHETFDTGKPGMRTTGNGVIFRVPLKPHEAGKPLPRETDFAWTATGLEQNGRPVSVEARRTVPLSAATAPAARTARRLDPGLDPILTALLAVAATLGALWLWGLLGVREPAPGARTRREALGFAAAAVTFGALWGMSRQVSFVGLAWIELALLALALCAWLRHRMSRRRTLSFLLTLCLAICAAAAPWLAHRNRLNVSLTAIPQQEDSPT